MAEPVLGIDIGGSGIKANLVDLDAGVPVGERFKVDTPEPSLPGAVADVVAGVVEHFGYEGPIGCTFPAVIRHGVAWSAANVHPDWVGTDVVKVLGEATGAWMAVVNDADAAGLAEMTYGAGRHREGVVILLTFGTGIGSAMFTHGVLVPNTEFGHLTFAGHESVEHWAAAKVRKEEGLDWAEWGARVDAFLHHIGQVFSPDLVIVGGGVSRRFEKFADQIDVDYDVTPAQLQNEAGIVGAAMAAAAG
jgi:polyphosphate glucokinase